MVGLPGMRELSGKIKNALMSATIPNLPKKAMSRAVGHLTQVIWPAPIARWSVQAFARYYHLDMTEAELSLSQYHSISELFTRRLKPGLRAIGPGIVHPVDGMLTQAGRLRDGTLVQAKGKSYTLSSLLHDELLGQSLRGGFYLTYYLCPTDYHRVHAPLDGEIVSARHIPGGLWPVNQWSVERVENLFAVNERVIVNLRTEFGSVAAVLVGATNVGQISVSFDPEIRTNVARVREDVVRKYDSNIAIAKGVELGVFHMGSSVIMLYPSAVEGQFKGQVPKAGRVRMGAPLEF